MKLLRMKRITLSIIYFTICLSISGQQVYQMQNRLRGDDAIERKQVQANGFNLEGMNNVWSLEDIPISSKTFKTEYTIAGDTLTGLERGNRIYYRQANGLLDIIGSENPQDLISYDMPETWLKFPMQQGDSVSGYFNGTGKYCDRLFMRRFGTYRTKADAAGKLVLPDGDTLRHVCLLTTDRMVWAETALADSSIVMIPTMQRVEQATDVYAINRNASYENNPEGSIFVADYREVRPFEAYVEHTNGARFISLDDLSEGDVTNIQAIHDIASADVVKVYNLSGVLLKTGKRQEVMSQLPKGIYIVNGVKVVVK